MTNKHSLLIINEFHAETVAKLDALYHTHHLWKTPTAQQPALLEGLQGKCRAAATGSWECDPMVYQLDSLELISCFGVGVDAIDFSATNRHGIRVTNTPDVLNDSVADIALALILATTRKLVVADQFVRAKKWQQGPLPFGGGLANKRLGIIGLGRIGEEIVKRALPFKLDIAYHNRRPKNLPYTYYSSIAELARNSDILLCMLPGGEQTENIIDAEIFRQLGSDGIFINVGRGSTVNEEALVAALQSRQIFGAGLDVYANEPDVPEALLEMENVVLLPHIGSATFETRSAIGNLLMQNLEAFFADAPLLSEVGQK